MSLTHFVILVTSATLVLRAIMFITILVQAAGSEIGVSLQKCQNSGLVAFLAKKINLILLLFLVITVHFLMIVSLRD